MSSQKEKYEKQKANQIIKVACSCGCVVSRGNLPAHIKTYIHIRKSKTFAIKVNKAERVKVLKFIEEKQKKEKYEKQKARQNIKVACRCGCVVSRVNISVHLNSDKHKQRILTGEYKPAHKGQGRKPNFGPMPNPAPRVVLSTDSKEEKERGRRTKIIQCDCGAWMQNNSMWSHKKRYHPELPTKKVGRPSKV